MLTATAMLMLLAPQQPPPSIETTVAHLVARVDAKELQRTVEDLAGFGTRQVLSATDDPKRGTSAARRYLQQKLEALIPASGGRLTVERHPAKVFSRRLGKEIELVNVVATLRGTSDPDRVYVVGGHYDSINGDSRDGERDAPGADDDASGTAAVVEACRAMCETPFAATVMFVCYDGEEMGLLGSQAHADELAEADTDIDGMLTNDIVGNTLGMDGVRRTGYVRCFSYAEHGNDSDGRSLARAVAFAARRHLPGFDVVLVYRGDRYGRGGDHRSFASHGWPAVRLTEPREDYSRQHADVTERDGQPYGDVARMVDFDYLAQVCRVNVAVLAELASAPPPPGDVRARGARDAYDTTITWTPSKDAAGYEAVWRATTAPDWEHNTMLDQPESDDDRLSAVLSGVCLDEVVVGVRAVGADGSRSRVSTPPEPDSLLAAPRSTGPRSRRRGGESR